MLDLPTIFVLAGLFFGLVVGDAAMYRDPVLLQISVPAKVAANGLTEAAAEAVFSAQVDELNQQSSFVTTPSVQMSSRPGVLAALAKPLQLDSVVIAVQTQSGADVIVVRGAIVAPATGNRLDMVTMIDRPGEPSVQTRMSREDGDATVLVQHSAEWTMEQVSPYRLALTHFAHGLGGDPASLQRAKDITNTALSRIWSPARATEHVMLHSLLASLALLDGNIADAKAQYRETDAITHALPEAYGVVALNRAFVALAEHRPDAAARHFGEGSKLTAGLTMRGWDERVRTLGALVAWSLGDLPKAEAILRAVVIDAPEQDAPHYYLAKLLEAKGDSAGAAAQRADADAHHRFENPYPSLPQSMFWVDPVKGGMQRRM